MNDNELMAAVVKSAEWNRALFVIVAKWRSKYLLPANSTAAEGWRARFYASEPWEMAHMINITLLVNLPQVFPKSLYRESELSISESAGAYALAMADIALSYDELEKKTIFEIHEQLLGRGAESIKNSMPNPWPTITWDELKASEFQFLESDLRLQNRG